MVNASTIWQHAAPTTDQLASPSCQKKSCIPKRSSLNEKYGRPFWNSQEDWLVEKRQDRNSRQKNKRGG